MQRVLSLLWLIRDLNALSRSENFLKQKTRRFAQNCIRGVEINGKLVIRRPAPQQHKKRHKELHASVDELFADYIVHHPDQRGFTSMPIMQLLDWAAKMAENPDHEEKEIIP
jgi:hypothetical protein